MRRAADRRRRDGGGKRRSGGNTKCGEIWANQVKELFGAIEISRRRKCCKCKQESNCE